MIVERSVTRSGAIGRSIWTKIIRNKKAVQYVFNAESYDFNYQFDNKLPEPIKLFPVGSSVRIASVLMMILDCRAMNWPLDVSTAPRTRMNPLWYRIRFEKVVAKQLPFVFQGGESTKEEMCLHMLSYYPRMPNMYMCLSNIPQPAWTAVVNSSV